MIYPSFEVELFYLIAGHFLVDFPLQSNAMAIEKNRHSNTPLQKEVPWYYWLTGHAILHGAMVALIMNSLWFGLAETTVHWIADYSKCEKWTNIHQDQAFHILCKVLWMLIALYIGG